MEYLELLMIIVIVGIPIIMEEELPISYLILALILFLIVLVVIYAVARILSSESVDVHMLRKLVREHESDRSLLNCTDCPHKKRLKFPWTYRCTVFGHNITRKNR